ncbi:MAG: insulinase family protein [Acidobacteria bacterium]|nr:insulinase family protein [Acidobacteriota bacterium]
MKRIHSGLGVTLAALSVVVGLRGQAPIASSDIPKIAIEKYQLPNGLEVMLVEDKRLPVVAVNIWYHVGPANEEPGRTGFAHLFEHMMFQGSKHVPKDAFGRILEGAGASLINGSTEFDRTNYYETVPANQLELALWLESDRMGYLLEKLDRASFANQQDVVRNERRESVENQPYGIVEEALTQLVYSAPHPYNGNIIGSHADIQAAQLKDVQNFFKLYYTPNNASLVIAGDFDKAATKKLVDKYFASLKRGSTVPAIRMKTEPIREERRKVVTDSIELPRVYMSWITSPVLTEGDAVADLTSNILGGGKSSRLYKKLVYEKQIAQNVQATQYSLKLGSFFQVQATAKPGHTAAEIEKALNEELDRLQREGPDEKEVERARNVYETGVVRSLETVGGLADRMNFYNHHAGSPDFLAKDLAMHRAVTAAAVKEFAQKQLAKSARVVVVAAAGKQELAAEVPTPKVEGIVEGAGADSVNTDEAWRNEMPKAGALRAFQLPVPASFKLANGLTVLYNERPGLPVVAASLVVRTGSDVNPLDKPGLVNFAVGMLDEGTATRSSLQLADEAAQLGASLTTSSTMDFSVAGIHSLRKTFPAALNLLADVVLHPSFPAEEIERERSKRLGGLVQERENPGLVSSRVMAAALYGPKHPYGYREIGNEAGVNSATREDMVNFWRQNFVPNNAALVVAGNISAADLRQLAEKAFGEWKAGTPARPTLGSAMTTNAKVVIVDKPGAQQTQFRVACIAADRATPDYDALEVMNTALGGLFSSRINLNLREEHGYTYGAGSVFAYRRGPGPFFAVSGVRTDVTAPAIAETLKELKRIAADPLTAQELALSKDSQVRSLPGQFETSSSAAGSFANLFVYGLPADYYQLLPARINAVTAEQALAAAKKYLVQEKLVTIAVGDRAKIQPELEKLNLGKTEIRDAEGFVKPN